MRLPLSHFLAFLVAGSFLVIPSLGEVSKSKGSKGKKSATASATSKATPKKKRAASPTPAKSSQKKPKPKGTPATKSTPTPAPSPTPEPKATPAPSSPAPKHAPNATLSPDDLVEFASQPPRVKALITDSLALTTQNLTYKYGSADPANGGMDCSGTIYYVLRKAGFPDVPRDSPGQYVWTRKTGEFRAVVSRNIKTFELEELLPGDLLFWTGTYQVSREIPVTHVMIYLGTEKKTKRPVMFGASDGRSYSGIQRWGVSVFDFKMPRAKEGATGPGATFIGYGRIPGLREAESVQ